MTSHNKNELETKTTLTCPTCGDPITWSDKHPHRPFCSKRCQLVDFGEWANENHKIEGSDHDERDLDEWE